MTVESLTRFVVVKYQFLLSCGLSCGGVVLSYRRLSIVDDRRVRCSRLVCIVSSCLTLLLITGGKWMPS